MSYSTLYTIFKTKSVGNYEYRNGYGTGPAIWDYISMKLTGHKFVWYPEGEAEKLWPLWKDTRLDDDERAVLLSTYDMAVVEINKSNIFSEACIKISQKIIDDTEWTWNHFKVIGEDCKKLHSKHDYRCIGLGIGCTSVGDPWEWWKGNKDRQTWGIYASIKALHNGEIE